MIATEPRDAPAADPYQRMAQAVLAQAAADAEGRWARGSRGRARREDYWRYCRREHYFALMFLGEESALLQHWCDLAGVSMRVVVHRYAARWLRLRRQARGDGDDGVSAGAA